MGKGNETPDQGEPDAWSGGECPLSDILCMESAPEAENNAGRKDGGISDYLPAPNRESPSDDLEHPAAEPSGGPYPALAVQGGISGGSTAPGKPAPPERKGTGHPLLRQYPLL